MSLDAFYTPKYLASILVDFYVETPNAIVDFCAGGGNLLQAAEKKWPDSSFYAIDYSHTAIDFLRENYPSWNIFEANFLEQFDLQQLGFTTDFNNYFDLILLNPPFSCKGATRSIVEFEDFSFKTSTAMEFFVKSIGYLSDKGTILAILPASVAFSDKDQEIWQYLQKNYTIKILRKSFKAKFGTKSPNVILVSLQRTKQKEENIPKKTNINKITYKEIIRGKLSMPDIGKYGIGNIPLVHSTNLKNYLVEPGNMLLSSSLFSIQGPAVLLPRVGNVRKDKIVIIDENEKYIISDCIIAVTAENMKHARAVFDYIQTNWDNFVSMYDGTGAKYTTCSKLKFFLR